jgi:hypothetical protein
MQIHFANDHSLHIVIEDMQDAERLVDRILDYAANRGTSYLDHLSYRWEAGIEEVRDIAELKDEECYEELRQAARKASFDQPCSCGCEENTR